MDCSGGRYFRNEDFERGVGTSRGRGISNFNNYQYAFDAQNQLLNLQNRGFPLSHMLVSPINNIVLLPNPPTQVFVNNKQPNRKRKWRKKKKRTFEMQKSNNAESNAAVQSKRKKMKTQKEGTIETVNLSDSNDSDVCYIEVKPPLVLLSSDEELKSVVNSKISDEKVIEPKKNSEPIDATDNDVIFVPNKEIVTITIDDDTETVSTLQQLENIPAHQPEVLGTPESTMSNDFLLDGGASDHQQNKFNFGLHGVDFNTKELNKQPCKPAIEKSETESSASDISTPIKTAVFNEVPFESPAKNIFHENNLKTFADFIVPIRSQNATTSKNDVNQSESVCRKISAESSSDSSSESDYEQTSGMKRKSRLPSLSLFEDEKLDDSTVKQCEITAQTTVTSSATANPTNSSDTEESKVNVVGSAKTNVQKTATTTVNSKSSDDNDDEEVPFVVSSQNSDVSSDLNMDSFVTVDEDFGDLSNKEGEKAEPFIIDSLESDDSFFDVDELEILDDDLQLVNCSETLNENPEPRDETVQKSSYSFDTIWTEDKERFYKDSWGHEDFNVTQVQKTMSGKHCNYYNKSRRLF